MYEFIEIEIGRIQLISYNIYLKVQSSESAVEASLFTSYDSEDLQNHVHLI